MDYKYDVFISYSRKDYEENGSAIPGNAISTIIKLLDENEISYWFDKDGIYSGSKFIEVINEAIMSSKMLIFISSRNSNVSKWTAGEILLASDAEMEILPVKIDDSGYSPKFNLAIRPLDFVDYYKNEAESLDRIIKAVIKIKADFACKQVAAEIQDLAKDCMVLLTQQEGLVKTLVAKNLSIGITTKKCPVCGKEGSLADIFCGRCGWRFPVLYALGGRQGSAGDKHHLTLAQANWQKVSADAESEAKTQLLKDENQQLRTALERITAECKTLKEKLSQRESDFSVLEGKRSETENECYRLQKVLSQTQEKLRKTQEELKARSQELQELKKKASASTAPSSVSSFPSATAATDAQLTFIVKGVSFKMIRVDGKGKAYYIGETQVTQALWQAVMKNNPSNFKGGNLPVEKVSWDDCQLFIKELNEETGGLFRLPTEAEWMYAAKGGNKSHGYMYSGSNTIDEVAWYKRNSNGTTHPVKSKKPNELDIYDMSGNVWEWCEDSDGSDRVYRGGGWASNAPVCRVAYHNSYLPSTRGGNLGFRLAL